MDRKMGLGRVLVTGGAGYLGTVLVPFLLDERKKVKIIDQFYFGFEPVAAFRHHPDVTITVEDILYQDNDPDLFQGVQTVVHLASISNDPSCDIDPNLSIRTNFLGTMALARRAKAEGVRHFIFASTCAVYGAADDRFLDEQSQTGPITLYALTKLECERELLKLSNSDFYVTILRFATLFGLSPRMRFDIAVNTMTKRALQNKSIIINGLGKQYRPFVHVRDAARAIVTVMGAPQKMVESEIFNVGDEALNYQISDLAEEIISYFPETKIERIIKNEDIRSYRPRFDKFKNAIQMPMKFGLRDAVIEIGAAYERGELLSMEEDRFYTLTVLRRAHSAPAAQASLAGSPRWHSLARQK